MAAHPDAERSYLESVAEQWGTLRAGDAEIPLTDVLCSRPSPAPNPVSYTHLTLPTNREV